MTATVSLTVPPLTDNEIWFANAAAWSNYWSDITAEVTFDSISTSIYTPSPYNSALTPAQITVDASVFVVPTLDQFNSLLAAYNTLNASYANLRTELYNAGFITAAQ